MEEDKKKGLKKKAVKNKDVKVKSEEVENLDIAEEPIKASNEVKAETVEEKAEEPEKENNSKEDALNKKEIAEQNKILKNVLIGIFVFIGFFAIGFYFMNTTNHFQYEGITFNIIKEKEVTFFQTSFLGTYEDIAANYNIFIRTDPRKLGDIPFEGKFYPSEMMVLNSSENFNCDGDGVIAVANFQNIMNAFGTTIINDPNASCDEFGRYLYVNLQSGDKTEITSPGNKCFNINIKDCEVLKGTERFLLEAMKYHSN